MAATGAAGGGGAGGGGAGGGATDARPADAGGGRGGGGGMGGGGMGGGGTGGGGMGGGGTGGGGMGGGGAFSFSSSGLVMMGNTLVFPPRHSAPTEVSLPFTISGVPDGTMSLAIILHDRDASTHWALWDIPPTTTMIAQGIPKNTATPGAPAPMGSKQTTARGGYYGPGATRHTYDIRLYALKVPTLPNPGTSAGTIRSRLNADAMGPKTLVIEFKEIVAQGQRGGIGSNPP